MKMDQCTALCFPDTVPAFATTAPLLLLLDRVVHYRPTESAPTAPPLFADGDLVRGYAPTPLGEDLDLFLRLVKDLRVHAGEYTSNFLSSLSPSMVSGYQKESVQQLINALTKGETQPAEPVKRDERFWQARLLLQLAEDIRNNETEIANRLAKVGAMQQQMLQSLRDDDADEITPIPSMPSTPPRLPIRDDLLCRCWCRLYLADRNQQRPALAATTNNEAAELLIDTYSQGCNQEPITICDLPLPALAGMNEEDFLTRRNAFRTTAADILSEIDKTIQTAMATGRTALDSKKTTAQWEIARLQHFGNNATNASRLRITLLAEATMTDLCQRLGKSDENNTVPEPAHTVLIHLIPLF